MHPLAKTLVHQQHKKLLIKEKVAVIDREGGADFQHIVPIDEK